MNGTFFPPATVSAAFRSAAGRLLPLAVWFIGIATAAAAAGRGGIVQSKHNLSVSGSGTVRANAVAAGDPTASEMCVFCHAPHFTAGQQALWNHAGSGAVYVPYRSSTAKANVGQPTGASRLCLGCHDGTVALGMVKNRSRSITMQGVASVMSRSRNNLGTDLSDDHPVSFAYTAALAAQSRDLLPPPHGGPVRLDANNELQCTTCHDPHVDTYGKFLVMDNTGSALCTACHAPAGWPQGVHSVSPSRWNNAPPNPWPHTTGQSVAAGGCENCHAPHTAGGKERLLNYPAEEQNCYPCHNGNVAKKNVEAEFNKLSIHPVAATTGVHDPAENNLVSAGATRHVECADCHDPHAASSVTAAPGGVSGALNGVRGISGSGASVAQVSHDYELCFRCHGDTAKGPSRVSRQNPQLNKRLQFQDATGQGSFHPVLATGRNPLVPSLKAPWTTASRMSCGDCHNSDDGPGAGGAGPAGPHGSIYPPLLERPLSFADSAANSANSALCFKCHDFVNTAWKDHTRHMGYTSCETCHDPHGSPNPRLINFDPTVVTGTPVFKAGTAGHGSCSLSCHGKVHTNANY